MTDPRDENFGSLGQASGLCRGHQPDAGDSRLAVGLAAGGARASRRRSRDRLDRHQLPRRGGRRRRDQDHAGDRRARGGPRGHHQDHFAEHRRPLEHQHRIRSGPLGRRSRQRRARPRGARRRQPAARGRSARGRQGRLRRRPGHLAGAVERHDERARTHRLCRTRTRRPLQRAARRGARAHGWRPPLRDARLDRP